MYYREMYPFIGRDPFYLRPFAITKKFNEIASDERYRSNV